jgi:hypothetical protein
VHRRDAPALQDLERAAGLEHLLQHQQRAGGEARAEDIRIPAVQKNGWEVKTRSGREAHRLGEARALWISGVRCRWTMPFGRSVVPEV